MNHMCRDAALALFAGGLLLFGALGSFGAGSQSAMISSVLDQSAQSGFVYAQGSEFMLNGQAYRVKGMMTMPKYHDSFEKRYPYPTNYPPGSPEYCAQYAQTVPQVESFSYMMFWNDFDEAKLDAELAYYADTLHVNTLRFLTPNPSQLVSEQQWHCWSPWFLSDGSINPVYRDRLLRLVALAKNHNIRIYLGLIADGKVSDWECDTAGTGAWQSCDLSQVEALAAQPSRVRFIRPGSAKEAFYLKYLQSLIPYLKDQPGIFAYEVGNENLQYWPLNGAGTGTTNSWYQEQVLSFLVRMIREVRRLDSNHLIGTGESGIGGLPTSYWAYPTAELGAVADIDHLGQAGQPIRLESFVDFIGVHAYNYTVESSALPAFVDAIRARSAKPIVFGEFNYYTDNWSPTSDPRVMQSPASARKAYYELGASLTSSGTAAGSKISGFFLYLPMPPVDLKGGYTLSDITWPGQAQPQKAIVINGPPVRKIVGMDLRSSMFTYDAAKPLGLGFTPEAQFFADLWAPPVYGALDVANCDFVGGWAKRPDSNEHLQVQIWIGDSSGANGVRHATLLANEARNDPLTGYGYSWIPASRVLFNGEVHSVYAFAVFSDGTNALLAGSPKMVQCSRSAPLPSSSVPPAVSPNVVSSETPAPDAASPSPVASVAPEVPAELAAQCEASGESVALRWPVLPGVVAYMVRVDYRHGNGSPRCLDGWFCGTKDRILDYFEGSSLSLRIERGAPYGWWVHPVQEGAIGSPAGGEFNCP